MKPEPNAIKDFFPVNTGVSLYLQEKNTEPNAIKIQGSVITGSCKYRKNLQGPVVFKLNAIKQIFPVFTGIFL